MYPVFIFTVMLVHTLWKSAMPFWIRYVCMSFLPLSGVFSPPPPLKKRQFFFRAVYCRFFFWEREYVQGYYSYWGYLSFTWHYRWFLTILLPLADSAQNSKPAASTEPSNGQSARGMYKDLYKEASASDECSAWNVQAIFLLFVNLFLLRIAWPQELASRFSTCRR